MDFHENGMLLIYIALMEWKETNYANRI